MDMTGMGFGVAGKNTMRTLRDIKRQNEKAGFTITEVVVSALIFTIATAGILATATAMRKPAVVSSEEVTAAFLAKKILDDLRAQLDSVTWTRNQATGGPFEMGKTYTFVNTPGLNLLQPVDVDGVIYTPSYTVVADPGGTQARKLNLTIDWPDN
jgi:type II secretory pathway pseudopilin PulG